MELSNNYYKNGIKTKRYYHNYNKKGKLKSNKNDSAYRIITTYNKKGRVLRNYLRYNSLNQASFKKIDKYKNLISINTKTYHYKKNKISYGSEVQRNNHGNLRSNKYGKSYSKKYVY